ncbi:M3 family oligoendopeptidase [Cohnella faecalis]|uniref:M3 family oligoendopeptidase n=1 Tax=Cohnella faecalis TaxID=2315694 RepID=A0A398CKR1_9BACL|nr:M3 family oligoendopeptidase [Cohnella faecalis]RIE02742.1 M3 family oligoendopeptidase [Cohnella faecalis]
MSKSYSMTWDLESLFPGGSSSPELANFMEETERLTGALLERLRSAGDEQPSHTELTEWTSALQDILSRLREGESFIGCLTAQQTSDRRAVAWTEKIQTLSAKFRQAQDLYDAKIANVPDDRWEAWCSDPDRSAISFVLNERRDFAKEKLSPELEGLASELAVDGYHGWGEHYNTIVGRIAIPWEENGTAVTLSAGQAANKLDHPKSEVRDSMAAKWEEAWAEQSDLCSDTLNRLAGFRLKLYGLRGWEDPLREPLRINRMSRETLDAMWEATEGAIAPLTKYLQLKARRFGKDKVAWHDVDAPLSSVGETIAYDDAAELIIDAFEHFSPGMAALARRAFDDRWIEAEDRPGKRPGGFCTGLPRSRQTRIFMTYSGTPGNVSTLAHELGHAYHGYLVDGLQPMAQEYAMNVAETASTFAEVLVSDALLKRAASDEEKLSLLDDRLQRAVAFCMNIRARFLFETRFYDRRKAGMLEADELGKMMVEAQKEAFGDSLSSWHPNFWAAKLHFYLTDVPFYNFPYTFGYLFSTGLVAVAEKEGESFRDRYDALLRDTGVMTVEQLASHHLGVRLDEPDFWRAAVERVIADVDAFSELAE